MHVPLPADRRRLEESQTDLLCEHLFFPPPTNPQKSAPTRSPAATPPPVAVLQGYQAILEFPVACGITVGTPVRIRGVPVGGVLSVQPSLEKVGSFMDAGVGVGGGWGGG